MTFFNNISFKNYNIFYECKVKVTIIDIDDRCKGTVKVLE